MDAVEEIKGRLNIEDVIAEYVQLKRAGRNWRGISPFTNEKTPSFMVSPEKQIWHDFSSGKGGNMFSFVMEMEGLDFKGALDLLARKAGVDLSQFQRGDSAEREKQKKRLYEILELAAKFYQVHFKKSDLALNYVFKKRGFTKDTALAFRLGYAPSNQQALSKFLVSKGYELPEIQTAGLAVRGRREPLDMFKNRLMVPLCDSFGRVVGFTARLLSEQKDAPKYINTPQTLLYDKSRHIYGLHLAKDAIRVNKFAVAVEGNLDVIASHQAKVTNVVATAGTAMTTMHLKTLSRLTPDVRIAFDQDNAGLNAAERTIPLASQVGVNLSVITIPSGKDPDELIKKDIKAWQKAIMEPEYALDWLIRRYESKLDIKSAQGKKQFADTITAVVKKLNDLVEKEHYLIQIAEIIGVSVSALEPKMGNEAAIKRRSLPAKSQPDDLQEAKKAQNRLLSLVVFKPAMRTYLEHLKENMFAEEAAQRIYKFLIKSPDYIGNLATNAELKDITDYVKILSLQFEELYKAVEDTELQYEAARLRARIIENFVKSQKIKIAGDLAASDEPATQKLLLKAKELDQLLNLIKER